MQTLYDGCIDNVNDEDSIKILQSISNKEKGHIELAKKLFTIIEKY